MADVLDRAAKLLDTDFDRGVKAKGDLLDALGETYLGLGLYERAAGVFERAHMMRSETMGLDSPEALQSLNDLAVAYQRLGRSADASRLREELLKRADPVLGPDHPHTLVYPPLSRCL
jgi:tetratricopeptide (TPR) repeat protein